jgi:hypothetical protein
VTVITPGAGRSITSTATLSSAGAVGCFICFFAGARLGLALATVRFTTAFPRAALDNFLALGCALAPFLFWTFDDCFLRLAIVGSLFWLAREAIHILLKLMRTAELGGVRTALFVPMLKDDQFGPYTPIMGPSGRKLLFRPSRANKSWSRYRRPKIVRSCIEAYPERDARTRQTKFLIPIRRTRPSSGRGCQHRLGISLIAISNEASMHFSVYDQHRCRLGGEVYLRALLNERAGLQDASDLSSHVKHAVWSHVEVTGSSAGVGTHQLPTVLDVQADRGIVWVVHATICRKKEVPRVVTKRTRQ